MATDKRLDQVSQLTDFDYALLVKGGQVGKMTKQQVAEAIGNLLYGATTKADLASVVAESMGYPICFKGYVTEDFNNYVNVGYYQIAQMVNNGPAVNYGLMLVIRCNSEILQFVSSFENTIHSRTSTDGGSSWKSWKQLG